MPTKIKKVVCACCNGAIVDKPICTVFYQDFPLDLCESCFLLGTVSEVTFSKKSKAMLLKSRANPKADPRRNSERVDAWINKQRTIRSK